MTNLSRKRGARNSGQAIVEGTVMMVILTGVAVALLVLLINATVMGSQSYRLQAVASEAARQGIANNWWLGMKKHRSTQAVLAQQDNDTRTLIEKELEFLRLGKPINFRVERTTKNVNGQPIEVMTVRFTATNVPVMSCGIFPSTVNVDACGIASDAEYAVQKHGMALIHVIDPTGKQRGIRVPVYNATIGRNTPAHPSWLRAGNCENHPTVYMRMECRNKGALFLGESQQKQWGNDKLEDAPWLK